MRSLFSLWRPQKESVLSLLFSRHHIDAFIFPNNTVPVSINLIRTMSYRNDMVII